MTGRNGNRQIGRTGPRIGLPAQADPRAPFVRPEIPYGATRVDRRGASSSGLSGPSTASHTAPGAGFSGAGLAVDPGEGPRPEPSTWRRPEHARLNIARLFEHMEPQPRSYRPDAYEDAPKITHTARRGVSLSPGSVAALILGSAFSIFVVFITGFLSAVLIFGEQDQGGGIAIQTGVGSLAQTTVPTPVPASVPAAGETLPADTVQTPPIIESERRLEGLVPSATAGRELLPPPSPEIAAAESARAAAEGTGQTSQQDPTPSVPALVFTPPLPNLPVASSDTDPSAMGSGIAQGIIFPNAKPEEPVRNARAAVAPEPGSIGPPAGNYSLQFGAFRDRANAAVLVRELASAADAGIVAEEGVSGATLYYVRAGAFDTRAEALEAVRILREAAGIVTFVHANRDTG